MSRPREQPAVQQQQQQQAPVLDPTTRCYNTLLSAQLHRTTTVLGIQLGENDACWRRAVMPRGQVAQLYRRECGTEMPDSFWAEWLDQLPMELRAALE